MSKFYVTHDYLIRKIYSCQMES